MDYNFRHINMPNGRKVKLSELDPTALLAIAVSEEETLKNTYEQLKDDIESIKFINFVMNVNSKNDHRLDCKIGYYSPMTMCIQKILDIKYGTSYASNAITDKMYEELKAYMIIDLIVCIFQNKKNENLFNTVAGEFPAISAFKTFIENSMS